jgi:hypothetical protein
MFRIRYVNLYTKIRSLAYKIIFQKYLLFYLILDLKDLIVTDLLMCHETILKNLNNYNTGEIVQYFATQQFLSFILPTICAILFTHCYDLAIVILTIDFLK